MQRHTFTALNSAFVVDAEYQFVKELGQGAYGCVVAARHRRSGDGCAIKKITNINNKVWPGRFTDDRRLPSCSVYSPKDAYERSGQ
jgi:serine/threonine protein kinase